MNLMWKGCYSFPRFWISTLWGTYRGIVLFLRSSLARYVDVSGTRVRGKLCGWTVLTALCLQCIYIYIYMHTNRYYIIDAIDINIHRFDYICIFLLCTYVYIYMYIYICVYIYVYIYVYMYIYIYVFAYTRQQFQCIYDETHTHIHIYIYIYICIPTSLQKKTHVFISGHGVVFSWESHLLNGWYRIITKRCLFCVPSVVLDAPEVVYCYPLVNKHSYWTWP